MLKHTQQILAKDFKELHEVTPITKKKNLNDIIDLNKK
jgi:hypothetical protein